MFCIGMMALVKIAASHTASHTASTCCVTHSAVEWSGEGWCSVASVSDQVLHRSFIVPAAPREAKGRMVRLAILMASLRDLTADLMTRPSTPCWRSDLVPYSFSISNTMMQLRARWRAYDPVERHPKLSPYFDDTCHVVTFFP
jgi:hypothetical protein